jgi:hypothetical protein
MAAMSGFPYKIESEVSILGIICVVLRSRHRVAAFYGLVDLADRFFVGCHGSFQMACCGSFGSTIVSGDKDQNISTVSASEMNSFRVEGLTPGA